MKFKPFNPSGGKSDLRQMYVTADDHDWIKRQASENSSRMVWVLSELIQHAKTSDAVFKRLRSIIIELDDLVPEGTEYPQALATVLDELAAEMEKENASAD